jgi:protein TonB
MTRAYPLYFDRPPVDGERRAQRIVASCIVGLHVLLLLWLLLSPQGKHALDSASHLIVVELGDAPARPASKPNGMQLMADGHSAPAAARVRAANPAGTPVRSPTSVVPVHAADAEQPGAAVLGAAMSAPGNAGDQPSRGMGTTGAHSRFHPPKTLHAWLPPYPEEAFRGNHQGTVDLLVTIDSDGTLVAARVDRSSGNASLDRAALESLDRYTFKAAERDGIAVRADAIVTINWIITQAIVQQFSSPRIERIDPANLAHQRVQTQYGSYLKALQRERDNDPDDRH